MMQTFWRSGFFVITTFSKVAADVAASVAADTEGVDALDVCAEPG
jgi:hypothetical protein